jgi:hypothetical protein
VDDAKMSNAKVALANIADRVLNTYNTNEGWVVKKMRLEYVNKNYCKFSHYLSER